MELIKEILGQLSELMLALVILSSVLVRILPAKAATWIRNNAKWMRTLLMMMPTLGINPATKDLIRKYNQLEAEKEANASK